MKRVLEVCTGNIESVVAAAKAGAERIELCAALEVGGVTPSLGMMQWTHSNFPELKVQLLIRSRGGNFVYDKADLETMLIDIRKALPYVNGIVCGALTKEGDIDIEALRLMMAAANGKPVTFHRAFDRCSDPKKALEQLIDAGCARILTSGHEPTAEKGIPLLRELIEQAGDRIVIMPGGGVTTNNIRLIVDQTGCKEIHGSFSAGTGTTSTEAVKQAIAIIAR